MAATRLRRTFQYPSESDDEDAVEQGMDEQDQEQLITNLTTKDTSSTRTYTLILLVLPLAPILLYIPRLFSVSTFIPSLAAITSLLISAYALYFLPLPPVKVGVINMSDLKNKSGAKGKGKAKTSSGYALPSVFPTSAASSATPTERPPVPYVSDEIADQLAKYILPVNGGLCVLLALVELFQGRAWSEGMMIGGGYVPGFILTVVLWARRELRVMDMSELERLRYGAKGS